MERDENVARILTLELHDHIFAVLGGGGQDEVAAIEGYSAVAKVKRLGVSVVDESLLP